MRQSPLHDLFASKDARFKERIGTEVVASCSDQQVEYGFVRDAVGVTDFSFMQVFRVPEESGIDFLDDLLAGNVAKVRFGRVLHTFLADEQGNLVADCYVANNDEEFILMCESLVDDQTLLDIFNSHGAQDAGLEQLNDSHAIISIDGYQAWAVVKQLFGSDVLGLPYLSIEMYSFEGTDVCLLRAGKTSEFGYLVMVPNEQAQPFMNAVVEQAKKLGGGLCGLDIHDKLRLEGRFFNVFAEGALVKDPLKLGLQWMIDFDNPAFIGREAILKRREEGVDQKIIGVKAGKEIDTFGSQSPIYDNGNKIGEVITSCFSPLLDAQVGLALLPWDIAYAGVSYECGQEGGPEVTTISMPPIMPKSLTVKLDEL
ncbi:MAG: hypothetical protein ACOC41_05410 [Chitinivibrionales bacterium]